MRGPDARGAVSIGATGGDCCTLPGAPQVPQYSLFEEQSRLVRAAARTVGGDPMRSSGERIGCRPGTVLVRLPFANSVALQGWGEHRRLVVGFGEAHVHATELPPAFFVIGAPRCGTTSLCKSLKVHPRISFSKPKETHFFIRCDPALDDDELRRTYLRQYHQDVAACHQAIGDGSVSYLYSPRAIELALRFDPRARVRGSGTQPCGHGLTPTTPAWSTRSTKTSPTSLRLVPAGATRCGRRHAQALPGSSPSAVRRGRQARAACRALVQGHRRS